MSSPSGSTPRSPGSRRRSQLAGTGNAAPGSPSISTPLHSSQRPSRASASAATASPSSPSGSLRRTSRPSTSQYATTSPRSPATSGTPSRVGRARASDVGGSAAPIVSAALASATRASSSPRQAPRTSSSQPRSGQPSSTPAASRGTPSLPTARASQGGAALATTTPSASGSTTGAAAPGTTRRTPGGSQGAKAKEALERDRLERQIREVNHDVEKLSEQVREKRKALLQGETTSGWGTENAKGWTSAFEELMAGAKGGGELEDIVKGMDDEALIALLTAPQSTLASALPPSAAESALVPPPISAGIEGLGSGHALDVVLTELRNGARSSLARGPDGETVDGKRKRRRTTSGGKGRGAGQDEDGLGQTEEEGSARGDGDDDEIDNVRGLLMARQDRLERLLAQLSAFTGMTLSETSSVELRGRAGRRKTIKGVLSIPAELELAPDGVEFEASFDVVKEVGAADSKGESQPRIERLDFDVEDNVREALEKDHWLTSAVSEGNLPGILQALRCLPQLASVRRSLFTSLAQAYPRLCVDYMERLNEHGALPGQDSPSKRSGTGRDAREARKEQERMRDFFIPSRAETLSFVNDRTAELRLTFAIAFNPFGHAWPALAISASLPPGAEAKASQSTLDLIESLPERFTQLLANAAAASSASSALEEDMDEEDAVLENERAKMRGLHAESAVRATVEAFFGLS